MRRHFGYALCLVGLLLLLCLFFLCMSYSLRPDDEGIRTRLEHFYAEPRESLDVVVIGSSAAYTFFSPLRLYADTGLTSGLYATANQSLAMIPYILRDCRKTQRNALYVIELRPILASADDLEAIGPDLRRLTDNMPYSLNRFQCVLNLVPKGEQLSWQWDMIKYHARWQELQRKDLRLRWGKTDPLRGGLLDSHVQQIERRVWRTNARIDPDSAAERELRTLLAFCRQTGVRALFVATPYSLSREQQKKLNACGDIVREYGYDFHDMNRYVAEIGLDFDRDYADFRHTNVLGMVKCTEYLGQVLLNYTLPGGRNQESWQETLAAYLPLEQAALFETEENGKGAGYEQTGT